MDPLRTPLMIADYCRRAKTEAFTTGELWPLTLWEKLGCGNPIGLDHVSAESAETHHSVPRRAK
jgi:hypothetical protein